MFKSPVFFSLTSILLSLFCSICIWKLYSSVETGIEKFGSTKIVYENEIILGGLGVQSPKLSLDIIWKGLPNEHMDWSKKRCLPIDKQILIHLKQNFYTSIYDIVKMHERWMKNERDLDMILPSMYSTNFQPCICSISEDGNITHFVNPSIITKDSNMNEIIEKVTIGNEKYEIKRNIPKKVQITYIDMKTWETKEKTFEELDAYKPFTCLLHLGLTGNKEDLAIFNVKKWSYYT